jgi:hypothetical protein
MRNFGALLAKMAEAGFTFGIEFLLLYIWSSLGVGKTLTS